MKKQQKAAGMLLGILAAGICMTAAAEEGKTSKSTLLTGLVFQSVADSVGLWSGAGAEKLEEDTGIRLEFYSNGGGNTQKLLQYLAAENTARHCWSGGKSGSPSGKCRPSCEFGYLSGSARFRV